MDLADASPRAAAPLLRLLGVSKEYRGVPALKNVDFHLHAGECHAVLGENGAGKSTLSKIISGVISPTRGRMLIEGRMVTLASPAEARKQGIAMVHQETSLVPSMTVAQNLYLGDEKLFNRMRSLNVAAQVFLNSLNFDVDPLQTAGALGTAKKQMVEIARAVRLNARIMIFDEPTATLTPEEKSHFFALIERLKAGGVGIIFISHALEEALAIADRITVLRDGERIVTGDAREFTREKIIEAMVGRTLSGQLYSGRTRHVRPWGREVLSVRSLSYGKVVRNNSFSVFEGQVTGMFGLIGSGRTETAKVIAGIAKRDFLYGGEVFLNGREVRYRTPHEAVREGVAYVTEDRKGDGFFETMSIGANLEIAEMAVQGNPLASGSRAAALLAQWTKALSIKSIDDRASVIELSGGNQQKVVIARSLLQRPKVIFLDEPTRGVDVGAIAEIHACINQLADEGLAVVVISSYLPEIMTLSDRVLVFRSGRVVEEFNPTATDDNAIMYAAVH